MYYCVGAMMEYLISIILGVAGLFVLLVMNFVIVGKFFSHKNKFTGPLGKFYHNLGAFFLVLLCIQIIFPLYIIQLNLLRFESAIDNSVVALERMYLGLFLIINIASFYAASKVLDNMDKLVDVYSFSGKESSSPAKKLRHIYFAPKDKK